MVHLVFDAWRDIHGDRKPELSAGELEISNLHAGSTWDVDVPFEPDDVAYVQRGAELGLNPYFYLEVDAGADLRPHPRPIEDLHAAGVNITGGMNSVEYVRQLRGDVAAAQVEALAGGPVETPTAAELVMRAVRDDGCLNCTVRQVLQDQLELLEYDGLMNPEADCACRLDDLAPGGDDCNLAVCRACYATPCAWPLDSRDDERACECKCETCDGRVATFEEPATEPDEKGGAA